MVAPTVREPDGLALSSRNEYLTPQERTEAPVLHRALEWARSQIEAGERHAETLMGGMTQMISEKKTAKIDFISIVDVEKLRPLKRLEGEVLVALAVKFGRARLIDNLLIQT